MRADGMLLCLLALAAGPAWAQDAALIRRGREVYISEGCIHCHSQYVRPGTIDEERWGPAKPLPELERQRPPLFGNRRQGPDLQNVGDRRTPDWIRRQLQKPRDVIPGSRMPAYAHLFRNGDGEALVAYLLSLGDNAP